MSDPQSHHFALADFPAKMSDSSQFECSRSKPIFYVVLVGVVELIG